MSVLSLPHSVLVLLTVDCVHILQYRKGTSAVVSSTVLQ